MPHLLEMEMKMEYAYTCQICDGENDERHTRFRNDYVICGFCSETFHDDEIPTKVWENQMKWIDYKPD